MKKKVVVLLADGFEEIEAVTPIDVLRRAETEVVLAGVGGASLTGAHGIVVQADVELAELSGEFDLVVLPGGLPGAENLGQSPEARRLVEKTLAAGKIAAAICAAPVMTLGAWGLLDGKNATCYPGMEKMFSAGVKFSSERVVVDGNIVTSRGPGTALEFSLALAGILTGDAQANRIAGDMLVK